MHRLSTISYDSFGEEDDADGIFLKRSPTLTKQNWSLQSYLKVGFSGEWAFGNVQIDERTLTASVSSQPRYVEMNQSYGNSVEEQLNLKKIKMCEVISDENRIGNHDPPSPASPIIVITYVDKSLYLMPEGGLSECKHIEMWIEGGRAANANTLEDQQLTRNDIPVIVDKCLKSTATHGCLTEGIYRIAGINSRILALTEEFRRNSWAVQLNNNQYSEHDVANTLKRFFRHLEDPLLTKDLRSLWIEASNIDDNDHKLDLYRNLLKELPKLNYLTLRRLILHLRTVSEQHEHNKMPVTNLATLWGPTILTTDNIRDECSSDWTSESNVIGILIENFLDLFDLDEEEIKKDQELLQIALDDLENETYTEQDSNAPKIPKVPNCRSGDIKVWIYVDSKIEGQHECLVIHPKMTVMEATTQVWRQHNKEYKKTHILHEVILEEGLERPMDHNEFLMTCILKWSNWPEEDRKHSYLILKAIKDEFGESLKSVGRNPSIAFKCEANYSPNTGRRIDKALRDKAIRRNKSNYIKCLMEFKGDSIICSKKAAHRSMWTLSVADSATSETTHRKSLSLMNLAAAPLMDALLSPPADDPESIYEFLTSWQLNEIFWYYGTESKRKSPSRFNITFIKRSSEVTRSRAHPYFGESISFENRRVWIDFVAALLQTKISQDRGPPPGIPSGKKPQSPMKTPSVISDIEENSSEEDIFEDCVDYENESIEFREKDGYDTQSKDSSETGVENTMKLNIGRLVSTLSSDKEERHSLKELLSSLSKEKDHIDERITSGSFVDPNERTHKGRSSSF